MRFYPQFVVGLVGFVMLAGACSSDSSAETIPPDTSTVLNASAEAMGEVETVRFGMLHSGAPVYIDPADIVSFKEADGRFVAPTSADAILTVGAVGLTVEIGAVAIDGETCLSNFITGEFEPAPAGYTFDPATLFDPDLGWRPLLADGLRDVEWVGPDEVDGRQVYQLRGLANQDRVTLITAGIVRGQDVILDLWIDQESGHVVAAEFDAAYRGEATHWRLTFRDYGEEMTVTAPASCNGG
jgi:lipoprotein LprG